MHVFSPPICENIKNMRVELQNDQSGNIFSKQLIDIGNGKFPIDMLTENGHTLDHDVQNQILTEKDRWRTVLKRIITCILYLASQNDSFRGKHCTIYSDQNGKFLKLIEMLASIDNPMAEHLRKIKNKEIHQHYLGPRIQTELINLIGNKIRMEIISRIKHAKYYTIMLDTTPDISNKEQLSLTIRILHIKKVNNKRVVEIQEYFINFLRITLKTRLRLTDVLKQ
ncbi:hypothetical protein AGLY_012428 [Aphis glycines]|uniref:DUF4371 domain-containing protein n=1 Tax=Aphis glycines TaxID=307491 RepID=A0A6G0TA26_APHGL|nr:hypothetical protein AGLY_012428 [Aphis glycines]